ncbi:peptide/nickel transport system permease protein [Nocardioides scoriae]|uniref:Peptide/nickel transport system permease protein n=1 Tax=Nocardioides scoriae TaxID=642780 RepID=A0A1H1N048_9ACTN|nr:ABC transporter permease [Nocardioides scoriae]SDR92322.1 peptide/nickel transport system permease protein [Nocardioides scoriae]
MVVFFVKRLVSSLLVVLVSSLIMYVLVDIAIDPLADLRTSTAVNKAQQIANRTAQLRLDDPVILRYLDWLKGASGCLVGSCDLGTNWRTNQQVTSLLSGAVTTTIQLVAVATVLSIVLGVMVGIVSALRQYSGFDYSITFLSFLLYSLPVFWVAVLAKVFLAIDLNNFLAVPDPRLSWTVVAVVALFAGLVVSSALAGQGRRRLRNFAIAAVATAALLTYLNLSNWFKTPSIGIALIAVSSVGWAFVMTILSTGLRNRRALYSALSVAALGVVLWLPMLYVWIYARSAGILGWPLVIGLFLVGLAVSAGIGLAWGGPDRAQSARTAALTAVPVSMMLFVDRLLQSWGAYNSNQAIKGRPIATLGRATPNLVGDFWIQTIDVLTHLMLPTATLILISFAAYTRYSRASMLEVMNADYIRTARSKGLTERTVIMRHAFRNALLPLASIVPIDIITLLGGAVLTETVFGWFGMGRLFVVSLGDNQQYPVMAYIIIVGILAVIANVVADLIYAVLDPRIRVAA